MGLLNKLKDILFDEETVEIPVITKEEKKEVNIEKKEKEIKVEKPINKEIKKDDEVIIKKIETPKKDVKLEDTYYDMPKFKEIEKKEPEKPKTFTFPVYEDDETEIVKEKRTKRYEEENIKKKTRREERKNAGYTNAYDYSYGKYKGDYKANRNINRDLLTKTLDKKDEKKVFTPSPIISPVYGVLNENYKKEDIVSRNEKKEKNSYNALDLDSVRRKAYGTLEDDIEDALVYKEPIIENDAYMDDEGISIDDLLVDNSVENEMEINMPVLEEENTGNDLLDDLAELNEIPEEIDFENEEITEEEKNTEDQNIKEESNEKKVKTNENEKKANDNSSEEDLFDLIDSLYEGKDEE